MKVLIATLGGLMITLPAQAKKVVTGEEAQKIYDKMAVEMKADPAAYYTITNPFFGDDCHPALGRVWITTISHVDPRDLNCYEYDYRFAEYKHYLCEVY